MMQLHDLDIRHLKDIPGYKAILKAVIKSQIQQLVEQLADHTGEESIILTASVSDGTLCNLGSSTGKNFLDGRDEIKSQFLRYCLKKSQRKKQSDSQEEIIRDTDSAESYDNRGHVPETRVHNVPRTVSHSQRVHPVALSRASPGSSYTDGRMRGHPAESPKRSYPHMRQDHHPPLKQGRVSLPTESLPTSFSDVSPSFSHHRTQPSSTVTSAGDSNNVNIQKIDLSNEMNVKLEGPSFADIVDNELEGSSSHGALQSSAQPSTAVQDPNTSQTQSRDRSATETDAGGADTSTDASNVLEASQVKIEPITESEMELEITGVEMATRSLDDSYSSEGWMPNVSGRMGYGQQASAGTDSETSAEAGQSGLGQNITVNVSGHRNESGALTTPKGNTFKEHVCGECNKYFPSRYLLSTHFRTHTGEKPFQCSVCEMKFAQKGNMMSHMRRRHRSEITYNCTSCGRDFLKRSELQRHICPVHYSQNT